MLDQLCAFWFPELMEASAVLQVSKAQLLLFGLKEVLTISEKY